MRIFLLLFLASLFISVSNCSKQSPDDQRAKQILSEINNALSNPYARDIQDVLQAITRLHDIRDNFPVGRDHAEADVRKSQEFFSAVIGEHQHIIAMMRELSSLGGYENYADCIRLNIEMQKAQADSSKATMDQIGLLLDTSITDKRTLDSRLEPLIQKQNNARRNLDNLKLEKEDVCKQSLFVK